MNLLSPLIAVVLLCIPLCSIAQQSNAMQSCMITMADNPDLAPLKEKVALGLVDDQTFRMLANKEFASKAEVNLIIRWVELRGACHKLDEQRQQQMSASIRRIYESVYPAIQDLALQLIDGKITYGEFAKQRRQAQEKASSDFAAAQQQIQGQQRQEASQNADAIRNQKAAACESARRNAEATCRRNTDVTINIGPYGNTVNDPNADFVGRFNCGAARQQMENACN